MSSSASKTSSRQSIALVAAMVAASASVTAAADRQSLDDEWKFHLGEAVGAQAATFGDAKWRTLDLPHDWSIELPTAATAPSGGGGGFFATGIGWYRRNLTVPKTWEGRRVAIEFEGVSANAEVWINGVQLGKHPYAYTPFAYDLTPHLKPGAGNVVSVRVDTSAQPSSRWYAGSGIYRHVWLRVSDPVHVVPATLFASTASLSGTSATVRVQAAVRNDSGAPRKVKVETVILSPEGRSVATKVVDATIAASTEFPIQAELSLTRVRAWSPATPVLHQALVRVSSGDQQLDESRTFFGVRTVAVSAERGFELNGRTLKLRGGNVHHDLGPLGAASFDRAEERRVALLKNAGFNAVRTSHNPPSTAFLDACDRQGLLVMDEAFDGWAMAKNPHDYHLAFDEWWPRDIDAMVLRDRNHPSVVMWSIGNEVYERGEASGQRLARDLAGRIRALDATRPIAAGINGLGTGKDWTKLDPLFAALDVAGYNYELNRHAVDHARVPNRVIVSAESYQNEAFANWAIAQDNPYVIGDFVWSALDYLGEAGIGRVFPPNEPVLKHWEGTHFPWHGAYCGDLDITGWRKAASHYRNIVWDAGEMLYMAVVAPTPDGKPWGLSPWSMPPAAPNWTWPGHEGQPLTVEVYSRYDAVRLSLNGQVLGEQPTTRAEQFRTVFKVPYASGTLKVAGLREGRVAETFGLKTAAAPAALRMTVDRAKIQSDGQDLAFVTVEVLDRTGVPVLGAAPKVTYELSGPGTIQAIGSGDLTTTASYQANPRALFEGRALVVIRAGKTPGKITLTASAPDLPRAEITVTSVRPR